MAGSGGGGGQCCLRGTASGRQGSRSLESPRREPRDLSRRTLMVWNRLKKWISGGSEPSQSGSEPDQPEIPLLPPDRNPWGVPVFDIRPVTLAYLSTSRDPTCAANAVSYGNEDGLVFVGQAPLSDRVAPAGLRYRTDRMLADGAVFLPGAMEKKWALFFHRGQLLCGRSLLRKVSAIAEVRREEGVAEVASIRGVFTADEEPPDYTVRVADFLIRSHALRQAFPAPLHEGMEANPYQAA